MRTVIQRVKSAKVEVGGMVVGEIGQGLLVLVGIVDDDTEEDGGFVQEDGREKKRRERVYPRRD